MISSGRCCVVVLLALAAAESLRADIAITGDDWSRSLKLGAEAGNPPPSIVTTADGRKSLHLPRPSGDKFALYLIEVARLPAGRSRFPIRVVAREVLDATNGLAVRNLTIDPDDPAADPTRQVQASFVALLLSDSDSSANGPRARDDRSITADSDEPNSLGGLSGARVEDPTLSTVTHPPGQLTTTNATLELKPGLNVLRLDSTDPRILPEYDPDSGNQIFSLVIGPEEPDLQGRVLGGITLRGEDWDRYGRLSADIGLTLPAVVTTTDGHRSLHLPRPSGNKFAIYVLKVSQLPAGKTRFPVKVLAREVRDSFNGLGIRNLTIDPDDPNSDRTRQVQSSFVAMLLSDGTGGVCPEAVDELAEQDHASTALGCAGGLGLSGKVVQDATLSPITNPAGLISTDDATLELRQGHNILRLDPTDPRDLPLYDPSSGYQLFLLNFGADEPDLRGEAVQPCLVTRRFSPNPYFPGDVVTVTLTGTDLLGETSVTDSFPSGWTVIDSTGGAVSGNNISFLFGGDGTKSYRLRAPDTCANVTFSGVTIGPLCRGEVAAEVRRLRCGIQFSGGISGMLMLGPIDLGNAGPLCDDQGRLAGADYLRSGSGGESGILPSFGSDLKPDFGGAAAGLGVKAASNTALNPRRAQGILTTWRASADGDGRINLQSPENVGVLEHHLVYGVAYLDNTTTGCLDAILEVSSDDAVKVLVNGRRTFVSGGCRTLAEAGQGERIPVFFPPGRNVVTLAVVQGTGGNALRLMLLNPDGSPLTDGTVKVSFTPPAKYLGLPRASVTRAIRPRVGRPGERVTVTLTASGVAGESTTIADEFPQGWAVADAGGGAVQGRTISFTRTTDGSSSYVLTIPAAFTGPGDFSGLVTAAAASSCALVLGDEGIQVVTSDLGCRPDPVGSPATLIHAFAFGSRLLECPTFNDPQVNYTVVHQASNDAAGAEALKYQAGRGWGYEVLYPDPAASPFGERAGFGAFGPFDDSKNDRTRFPDRCPEELYDSNVGLKDFPQICNQAAAGSTADPCTASTVLPGGAPYHPVGAVFRVDVPDGRYRFVAAVGDSSNPHTHRILVEDGGSGPPANIGPNQVVLVRNFDQSQYSLGETDAVERGQGMYARVGFDCRIPPPGDGVAPSPRFVNMDASGRATAGPPNSPELAVTSGYLRVHQLQGNSNAGPGSSEPDGNGSDLVVFELWRVGSVECPAVGDTHCKGISVAGPAGGGPGRYTATATAADDRKDGASEEIRYTFRAVRGAEPPLLVGPQTGNTAAFDLGAGAWTVSVGVDDDPACPDRAADDSCSTQVQVTSVLSEIAPGDCNGDGAVDISDSICILLYLFVSAETPLPCGDGTLNDASNVSLLDFNGDHVADLSDGIGGLSFLFTSGPGHVLGQSCVNLTGCKPACPR